MRRVFFYFLFVFLALSACHSTEPKYPEPVIVPDVPETVEGEPYSYSTQNKNIALRFNTQYFPAEFKTVELVWSGSYQGYFDLADIIYLPFLNGTQALEASFTDVYGDTVFKKTYYLNLTEANAAEEEEEEEENIYYYKGRY